MVKIATVEHIDLLLPALMVLRTNRSEGELREMIETQMQQDFSFAYIGNDNLAFAVMGFRIMDMLHSGKTLYIDDLVTHSDYRKKGYAKRLLEWVEAYAKEKGCDTLSLDSGFHRKDAYRLYLNFKFEVSSLHFSKILN